MRPIVRPRLFSAAVRLSSGRHSPSRPQSDVWWHRAALVSTAAGAASVTEDPLVTLHVTGPNGAAARKAKHTGGKIAERRLTAAAAEYVGRGEWGSTALWGTPPT